MKKDKPNTLFAAFICVSCLLIVLAPFDANALNSSLQLKGHVKEIISEVSTWEDQAIIYRKISRFDEQGRTLERETAFLRVMNGSTHILRPDEISTGRLFYDQDGRHIKTIYIWPNGSVQMVTTFAYDDQGNRIDHTSLDKDGNITLRFAFSYDINGDQVQVQSFNGQGQLLKRILNEYNDVHQLTESIGFNADGSVEYRIADQYDSKGSKVSSRYNASGALDEKVVSTYLDNGLITEEVRYKANGNISSKKRYSYEYDEKGNWTKETSTQLIAKPGEASPEPAEITRRAIKYY